MPGLFDTATPSTLADVLGQQASTATQGITNDYAKQRRKLVAQQASTGRLRSGVSNYNFGDLNASELSDIGGVQSSLADALGGIPAQDYLSQQDFSRQKQLAELIAKLNEPSTLSEVFGGLGAGLKLGGLAASFAH